MVSAPRGTYKVTKTFDHSSGDIQKISLGLEKRHEYGDGSVALLVSISANIVGTTANPTHLYFGGILAGNTFFGPDGGFVVLATPQISVDTNIC